ncbi:MAG: hypothetical protein K6G83_08740 [Lachnospiraceae bacterium]|nr:hypothetical protein [Lachnospiraceae bacterium]
MKLIGELKEKVIKAESKEEAKGLIERAGMSLTADELEMVTGGGTVVPGPQENNEELENLGGQPGNLYLG